MSTDNILIRGKPSTAMMRYAIAVDACLAEVGYPESLIEVHETNVIIIWRIVQGVGLYAHVTYIGPPKDVCDRVFTVTQRVRPLELLQASELIERDDLPATPGSSHETGAERLESGRSGERTEATCRIQLCQVRTTRCAAIRRARATAARKQRSTRGTRRARLTPRRSLTNYSTLSRYLSTHLRSTAR